MKIESVDFFYLSMEEVLDIGDGSQDALLVRIRAGGYEGWGECEASPLVSIAAYICPMSHSACKPVQTSLIGCSINSPKDIIELGKKVRENSFDLLQADHTFSGIDIALWDLLGKIENEPVYKLLGYKSSYKKLPYASQLFGDTPEETFQKAKSASSKGYRAAKFGWGPYGKKNAKIDEQHVYAAREGIGKDNILLIDAGTIWESDVDAAKQRMEALKQCKVQWLEEPFASGALSEYKLLSTYKNSVGLAGGEGCHNYFQAKNMIDFAGLTYIQIDTGRIGGITEAKKVADYAQKMNVSYVNHTFTTHLALSASLQPFAGIEKDIICEYPVEPKSLATDITKNYILPNDEGFINLPEKPGLGIDIDTTSMKKYLVDTEIKVNKKIIYQTPNLD